MKKRTAIVFATCSVGAIVWLWFRKRGERRISNIHVMTCDLEYQDLSPGELDSAQLVDLNHAGREKLEKLNLNPDSLERLIENRPYRSKLELISRMVMSESEYEAIKEKVGIAEGREPVKIA